MHRLVLSIISALVIPSSALGPLPLLPQLAPNQAPSPILLTPTTSLQSLPTSSSTLTLPANLTAWPPPPILKKLPDGYDINIISYSTPSPPLSPEVFEYHMVIIRGQILRSGRPDEPFPDEITFESGPLKVKFESVSYHTLSRRLTANVIIAIVQLSNMWGPRILDEVDINLLDLILGGFSLEIQDADANSLDLSSRALAAPPSPLNSSTSSFALPFSPSLTVWPPPPIERYFGDNYVLNITTYTMSPRFPPITDIIYSIIRILNQIARQGDPGERMSPLAKYSCGQVNVEFRSPSQSLALLIGTALTVLNAISELIFDWGAASVGQAEITLGQHTVLGYFSLDILPPGVNSGDLSSRAVVATTPTI